MQEQLRGYQTQVGTKQLALLAPPKYSGLPESISPSVGTLSNPYQNSEALTYTPTVS